GDECYAALADVCIELRGPDGTRHATRSTASGAVLADIAPGAYEVCLSKPGFGAKRARTTLGDAPVHFRLLADRLLGYAWPKWCRGGEPAEFRVHTLAPYKLGFWRYGLRTAFILNAAVYTNHSPRA